ncbi:multidrug efflux pump subunit AcrB [Bradyrhizobium sp. LM6.10]
MKRFNLSAWAVSHPTLVLFLMVILGIAGFFSYQKLGRAEDPFFTVKVVNVSVIWPGATAQEMQAQVADPIEKKIQELPYFEKVQTYSKPGFTALQVTFRDSTPPKDVPYLFYLLRKKLVDVQAQLPAGILGPRRQRRVLRRRFDPLHDDRRRCRLCAAQEGLGGFSAAPPEGARRDQGRRLRQPG